MQLADLRIHSGRPLASGVPWSTGLRFLVLMPDIRKHEQGHGPPKSMSRRSMTCAVAIRATTTRTPEYNASSRMTAAATVSVGNDPAWATPAF